MESNIQPLLSRIRIEREKSLGNCSRTDLYSDKETEKIKKWYDRLSELIDCSAPLQPVRELRIFEDSEGHIRKIGYVYWPDGCVASPEALIIRIILGT